MAGPIDGTLDELEAHLRELKREVSTLEAFRRQLELAADDEAAAANESASSRSSMPLSA
jgi:hypothetical protein